MTARIQLYTDGGARGNPGPAAIGILICDTAGKFLRERHELIGPTTNNVAEYTAVIRGLELAAELRAEEVHAFMDSQLVANQLGGTFRVKTPHILDLYKRVQVLLPRFKKTIFTHVPRTHEKIRYVDKLVNLALDRAGH